MRKSLILLLVPFAWAAACSNGSIPATLIPPGPSDPGGPSQDTLGSETSSPATTTTPIGTGGQVTTTTTTTTSACAGDGMPCSVASDCCEGTCSAANVCISTCGNLGDTCGGSVSCCDPTATCVQSGTQSLCCMPMGGSCLTDSDCCQSPQPQTCTIGACEL